MAIIGHQKQWEFLTKSAGLGRLPHGLLFSGQGQLGKKTLAIEFAKFLNCSDPDSAGKPCGICRNCQDIQKGIYPDFILIESAPGHKEIQISQIRDLIWKMSLRSYSSTFKIAVLDKSHSMTKEAQNCFLKLLEEPPGRAVIILVTENPETLLPTILSRVQKLKFFPVKQEKIEAHLISRGLDPKMAEYYSSECLGKPGLAIDFFLKSDKMENQKKLIADFLKIYNSDLAFRFQYVKSMLEEKKSETPLDLQEVLDVWLGYLRNNLLSSFSREKNDPSLSASKELSISKIARSIASFQETKFLLSKTNINTKLALEELFIEL